MCKCLYVHIAAKMYVHTYPTFVCLDTCEHRCKMYEYTHTCRYASSPTDEDKVDIAPKPAFCQVRATAPD